MGTLPFRPQVLGGLNLACAYANILGLGVYYIDISGRKSTLLRKSLAPLPSKKLVN
jgi:hypothetical protein